MASGEVNINVIGAETLAALLNLLERMDDGEVWSVDIAAQELREILEKLRATNDPH